MRGMAEVMCDGHSPASPGLCSALPGFKENLCFSRQSTLLGHQEFWSFTSSFFVNHNTTSCREEVSGQLPLCCRGGTDPQAVQMCTSLCHPPVFPGWLRCPSWFRHPKS